MCCSDFTAKIRIFKLTGQIQYSVYVYAKINFLSPDIKRDKTVVEDLSRAQRWRIIDEYGKTMWWVGQKQAPDTFTAPSGS